MERLGLRRSDPLAVSLGHGQLKPSAVCGPQRRCGGRRARAWEGPRYAVDAINAVNVRRCWSNSVFRVNRVRGVVWACAGPEPLGDLCPPESVPPGLGDRPKGTSRPDAAPSGSSFIRLVQHKIHHERRGALDARVRVAGPLRSERGRTENLSLTQVR